MTVTVAPGALCLLDTSLPGLTCTTSTRPAGWMMRHDMAKAEYNDARYRAAKVRLRGLPCYYCGEPSNSVEHLVPRAMGGDNSAENLVPACLACNAREGGRFGAARRAQRKREVGKRW